jgi:signal transduction histidine kinase
VIRSGVFPYESGRGGFAIIPENGHRQSKVIIRGRTLLTGIAASVPPLLMAALLGRGDAVILIAAGFAAGICAAAAVSLIARKERSRLSSLGAAARSIGEGDFDVRVWESGGTDEIGSLENGFNKMAESLVEKRKRFAELDQVKSDFVSSVSHELRTPLTTIKALTRLLIRGELAEEKRREYLETISVECDRQIDLVLNLLDLSRIEGGVFRISLDKVDVGGVIRSCVKSESSAAEKRLHTLTVESFGEIPPVCADPKALRRVVSNLIENSIKYTPDGGLISLFARAEGDFVRIDVRDNGRGIPPEDLPVLFDKFHRGRPAPHSAAMDTENDDAEFLEDADVSGVGLGLYLARNVMERMRGRITVETEVGSGSTFTLQLPVWRSGECGSPTSEVTNGKTTAGR